MTAGALLAVVRQHFGILVQCLGIPVTCSKNTVLPIPKVLYKRLWLSETSVTNAIDAVIAESPKKTEIASINLGAFYLLIYYILTSLP